jgi:hypothetical protein
MLAIDRKDSLIMEKRLKAQTGAGRIGQIGKSNLGPVLRRSGVGQLYNQA